LTTSEVQLLGSKLDWWPKCLDHSLSPKKVIHLLMVLMPWLTH
jgi:hypothetical protein